jgi:MFS family permease
VAGVLGPVSGQLGTLAVLCLSLLVVVVDNTVVNVALPTLVRHLHASTTSLQWVVDAYTLALAGLLLTLGSLGDRIGRHRLLAGGLVVFGVGSALAAVSGSADRLIFFRALMGVGAAAIMPATLSIQKGGPVPLPSGRQCPASAWPSARPSVGGCSSTSTGAPSS